MHITRFIILVITLWLSLPAMAKGGIMGIVVDKATSSPMDFANITLSDKSSGHQLPVGESTGLDGKFMLSNVDEGNYIVRVSYVGYIPQEREVMVSDTIVNLGIIALAEDSKLLSEVVVTGQKSRMRVDADKMVFNVKSNIGSAGASANDLLGSIPSVMVNNDGEISLRGKADVVVLVDGKALGMTDENRTQILRQIPAETIESIEVMTTPQSQYSAEGTAGVINIRLRKDHRHGYFGNVDASVDSRGSTNANFNINYNEGRFETYAGVGLKSNRQQGGVSSSRRYDYDGFLDSHASNKQNENGAFLRFGVEYKPDKKNTLYLHAIGSVAHKWGHVDTKHVSNLPSQWSDSENHMKEKGNSRGANIELGYSHYFDDDHNLRVSLSYNVWQGPNDTHSAEIETWPEDITDYVWRNQHQNVRINNWEADLNYNIKMTDKVIFNAGYKGNYNSENSPASYSAGTSPDDIVPLPDLYNRFKYRSDVSALFVNVAGTYSSFNFSVGLRGELWQICTRSLGYEESESDIKPFRKSDFALFPTLSLGWNINSAQELIFHMTRRIRRPYGPQLNTFENISDPSEVHLGNPHITPEFSNAMELTYQLRHDDHLLSASGYFKRNTDIISHVSFLAPMATNPDINTMYYGHANVGNMTDVGVEIVSRNPIIRHLTLTTTINLYNSHLKAWQSDYPLHGDFYVISGQRQHRWVVDGSLMLSAKLPWNITLQATGRYTSKRITAQGMIDSNWDLEAGLRRAFGRWDVSLFCKDIFDSKKSTDILYGNGYRQKISKWMDGPTLRLAVSYTFGRSHNHDHKHLNEIDTGGYDESHTDHVH